MRPRPLRCVWLCVYAHVHVRCVCLRLWCIVQMVHVDVNDETMPMYVYMSIGVCLRVRACCVSVLRFLLIS